MGVKMTNFEIRLYLSLEVSKIAHGASITSSYLSAVFSSGSERMGLVGRVKKFVEPYFNYHFNSKIYDYELSGIFKKRRTMQRASEKERILVRE
ncbi:hypothetical protein B9Z55_015072 [Caenorhabditis nigoni]|uniref:Uncharacterized protein n=1 Tax=Caenorhabditis nigoni TaxID=1611254 RepID=A0A2G5U8R7_9PELO|nr:hypothetical protein B9Z55_015072 [Caenorhabditis nigoni]